MYRVYITQPSTTHISKGPPRKWSSVFKSAPSIGVQRQCNRLYLARVVRVGGKDVTETTTIMVTATVLYNVIPVVNITLHGSTVTAVHRAGVLRTLTTLPRKLHSYSAMLTCLFSAMNYVTVITTLTTISLHVANDEHIIVHSIIISTTPVLCIANIG